MAFAIPLEYNAPQAVGKYGSHILMSTKKKREPVHLSDHFTVGHIFRQVYPSVLMMIFSSLYNVVDGLFISNFSSTASLAGVNLIMPLVMIVGGLGFMFGNGGSALVSKTLGEGKRELANRYFSMTMYAMLILGVVVCCAGYFCVEPFARWMASLTGENEEAMIQEAIRYGHVLMPGQILFMSQNAFQAFFITDERKHLGFFVTLAAGVTNMVLDALFIGAFRWGVVGAASATLIGQAVGSLFPFAFFLFRKKELIHLVATKIELRPVFQVMGNGVSEFASNITSSVVSVAYNAQLLAYAGSMGVASYGIIMYICYIFFAVFIGYSSGLAPVIGFHYGAGNKKELHNLLDKSLIIIGATGVIMFALAEGLAHPLALVFGHGEQELIDLTVRAERIYSFVYLACGFSMFSSAFFTALSNGIVSAIISLVRSLVFELVCVLTLPYLWGVNGIWASAPFAEIGSSLTTLFFFLKERKRYGY